MEEYSDEKISSIVDNIKENNFTYHTWKNVEVVYKGKTTKKLKMLN